MFGQASFSDVGVAENVVRVPAKVLEYDPCFCHNITKLPLENKPIPTLMIYDFQYLPFSLGDILTWSVHQTVQAKEAHWQPKEIRYQCQLKLPHPMQPFIKPGKGKKYLGELPEAFLFNPLGLRVAGEEGRTFREHVRTDYMRDLKKLKLGSPNVINIKDQTRFFEQHVASHKKLNDFYQKNGQIPFLQAPLSVAKQTSEMIRRVTGKTRWICVHIRFRGYDQRWDLSDAARNADPVVWFGLLDVLAANYLRTHAILLMGEVANYPTSFLEIPGVHSLRKCGGTLKNDLASIFAAQAFLGSSSGFATAANFSQTPYAIFNVTPSGYHNYAIRETEEKLPFAHKQQLLSPSYQDLGEMVKTVRKILPVRHTGTKNRLHRLRSNHAPNGNLSAFTACLIEQINRHQTTKSPKSLEKYFQTFEAVIPEAKYTFEVHLARKIASKKSLVQDAFLWSAYRQITEIRADAAWDLISSLTSKEVIVNTALPKAVRARELAPQDIRIRAIWNLLRRAQKLRVNKLSRGLFKVLVSLWVLYYRLFYGFGVSYRSKGLHP